MIPCAWVCRAEAAQGLLTPKQAVVMRLMFWLASLQYSFCSLCTLSASLLLKWRIWRGEKTLGSSPPPESLMRTCSCSCKQTVTSHPSHNYLNTRQMMHADVWIWSLSFSILKLLEFSNCSCQVHRGSVWFCCAQYNDNVSFGMQALKIDFFSPTLPQSM